MIIIDNCILSSLSKIDRLDLLKDFNNLFTTPGVIEEALRSENTKIIESISSALDDWLIVKPIKKPQKIPDIQSEYPALSYIDCELILLCKEQKCILLTDDTKLINISENDFNIDTFDLFELLIALKYKKKIGAKEINKIVKDLENIDHYKFSKDKLKLLLD